MAGWGEGIFAKEISLEQALKVEQEFARQPSRGKGSPGKTAS